MTIDLTGPVPQVISSCDHCARVADLYRLAGTQVALCQECFAHHHS